jgi:hypothetical protein
MEQRVSIIEGKTPIILIATNGLSDKNTDLLTEMVATKANCFAVINWGWERCIHFNFSKEQADCNNLYHIFADKQGVIYDEFLEPILRFKNRIAKQFGSVFQFILQGVAGNNLPKFVDIVAGDGAKNRSCDEWARNLFIHLASQEGINAFLSKNETSLQGGSKKNLNQLFTQWYPDDCVQSMQLEIVRGLRETHADTEAFSEFLAEVIQKFSGFDEGTADKFIPWNFNAPTV